LLFIFSPRLNPPALKTSAVISQLHPLRLRFPP